MVKKILKRFIQDRMLLIVFYLFNIISVIAFFHLSVPANTEVMYPLFIGLFLLFVYLVIDWIRYYQVNEAIEKKLEGTYTEMPIHTGEQRAYYQWITKMNQVHSSEKNEQAKRNKDRLSFLSHWMHHLKTPVSVIDLIIQNDKHEQTTTNTLEKVRLENKRLHTAIEQGLTMIRMDSFENDLDIKSVQLLSSIRKVINNRKSEFIYHSIFPVLETEDEDISVITDQKWNEVMLDQIISNAIKYSSSKNESRKIRFSLKKQDEDVTLSITDHGVGIPSYDLERVFEAFFTGENGRKNQHASGIGLYLCKRIAERLKHSLSIKSEVSEGTTVSIRYLTKV